MVLIYTTGPPAPKGVTASLITSNTFSPPAGSTIIVGVTCNNGAVAATSLTDSLVSHLSWGLIGAETANGGDAEIWSAYCASAQTNMTVTANFPSSQTLKIFVIVLINANSAQSGNAVSATTSASGTPASGTVTTTADASYVISVIANMTNTTAPSTWPGQYVSWNGVNQFVSDGTHSSWMQSALGQGDAGQAVTVKDSAPASIAYAMVAVEILSAASPAILAGTASGGFTTIPSQPIIAGYRSMKSLTLPAEATPLLVGQSLISGSVR